MGGLAAGGSACLGCLGSWPLVFCAGALFKKEAVGVFEGRISDVHLAV